MVISFQKIFPFAPPLFFFWHLHVVAVLAFLLFGSRALSCGSSSIWPTTLSRALFLAKAYGVLLSVGLGHLVLHWPALVTSAHTGAGGQVCDQTGSPAPVWSRCRHNPTIWEIHLCSHFFADDRVIYFLM
uniref:Uncharacterized protein n=1 Tax=Ixodes ricinus TaxID=34613 RepID=A0A147BP29_IXORI